MTRPSLTLLMLLGLLVALDVGAPSHAAQSTKQTTARRAKPPAARRAVPRPGAPRLAVPQPLGFLFGTPAPPRTYRLLRPRPAPAAPSRVTEVPLPPPRPHFPDDPPIETPPADATAAKPVPARPSGTAKPAAATTEPPAATTEPPAATTKPPAATTKPQAATTEAPAATTAAPAATTAAPAATTAAPAATESKPGAAAAPLPPEKPADLASPGSPPIPVTPSMPEELPTRKAETPAPVSGASPTVPAPAVPAQTMPPLPPKKPPELAAPGAPSGAPGVAPSGAKLGEVRQPEDDATCPGRLKAHDVDVEPTTIGPQPDARCTVVQAVHLIGLTLPGGGKIEFPEHPTIACTTADAFSFYVRDLLSPLAKGTFGAPLAKVWTGPGLECRSRDHIFGAKLSAHGQGLAIDIAQLKLADGRMIEIGTPKGDEGQAFETAARSAACGFFHTVLGPGSDSYHKTHWHFDLEVRGSQGDSKYCK